MDERRVVASVRRLTPGDAGLMRELLDLFGSAFGEPETYSAAQPGKAYLERLLSNETFFALIAQQDDVIVGGLCAYELTKFEQERSEIYIYDLAVAESCRRQGIATALIDHLRTIGRTRGAYVVFVQADEADTPAVELYSKLGIPERVLHFDIGVA